MTNPTAHNIAHNEPAMRKFMSERINESISYGARGQAGFPIHSRALVIRPLAQVERHP